jgi:hypothetical protein
MKAGVDIVGRNRLGCVLSPLTSGTTVTLVNMAVRMEMRSLTLTFVAPSASPITILTGVSFPLGLRTAESSRLVDMTILIDVSTLAAATTIAGISSAGGVPLATFENMVDSSLTVIGSANAGAAIVGITVRVGVGFNINNAQVDVRYGFSTNGIAARTTGGAAFIIARDSFLSGTQCDIQQTAGIIQLGATKLAHSNACGLGFMTITQPSTLLFGVTSPAGNTFLDFGTTATASATVIEHVLTQDVVLLNLVARARNSGTAGTTLQLWVQLATPPATPTDTTLTTSVMTTTGTAGTYLDAQSSVSITGLQGQVLAIHMVVSGANPPTELQVTLDVY